jgi:predicted N-acyltransferase
MHDATPITTSTANAGLAQTQLHIHTDPCAVDAQAWDDLLSLQPHATPFLRMAYLRALHTSQSAVPKTGWSPVFMTLTDDANPGKDDGAERVPRPLLAACAMYLKTHSYGEYVFDWAWAEAYQRHGLDYYPKLLAAVPFTPVPGTRLMARDEAARRLLLRGLQSWAQKAGLSSAHLLFLSEEEAQLAQAEGWLLRHNVQFHWTQRTAAPWPDFDAYLQSLQHDKRKKIKQERRRVMDAGVQFDVKWGREIGEADWDFFYRCYSHTYRAHHSTPYLSREFFREVSRDLPEHWLLLIAKQAGEPVAASLVALDPGRGHAFGRYWGCVADIPCLHFEACYYQPLQWCLTHGYTRFEGGAQGEHKMARGLMPQTTVSAHWLAHPQFANAVAEFLQREGEAVQAWREDLEGRSPFAQKPPPPSAP